MNEQCIKFLPENFSGHVNLDNLFEHVAPIQVDAGCGNGSFLIAMAEKYPDHNFLGIEHKAGRVENVCRKVARLGLRNVRLICMEVSHVARQLLSPGSIAIFHVAFADPWPKRRHQHRRLVNHDFLSATWNVLGNNGELRLVTDDLAYFNQMEKAVSNVKGFQETPFPENPDYPQTTFERHFRAQGLPIYRIHLRKI